MNPLKRAMAVALGGLLLISVPVASANAAQDLSRYKHTRIYQGSYHIDPPQGQCCAYYVHEYEVCSQQITPVPGGNNCTTEAVRSSSGQTDPPSVTVNSTP